MFVLFIIKPSLYKKKMANLKTNIFIILKMEIALEGSIVIQNFILGWKS